jgi:amino-acid N-acetyltransferase
MADGILVKRTEDDLLARQADFVVYSIDDVVHACGALHEYGEGQAEIAAIATNPVYSHLSMGRKIVSFLIEKAVKMGMSRVFVLTTQTLDWFESIGFVETDLESLPAKKRQSYNHARKSRIFALELKDLKPIKS